MQNREAMVASRVDAVRAHFEQWRRSHPPRTRIPETLWQEAADLAGSNGLNRTASLLRLGYYDLKQRVEANGVRRSERRVKPAFVEFVAPQAHGGFDCVLELEDARGAKLRLQTRGLTAPDAAVLSSLFWDRAR